MFKKIILFIVFSPVLLFAQVTQHSIKVTGVGSDYRSAVKSALIEAVSEVNGVNVSTVRDALDETFKKDKETIITHGNKQTVTTFSKAFQNEVTTATKGSVVGYQVLNSQKTAAGWAVILSVKMSEYKSVDDSINSKLDSIVIMPFRFASGSEHSVIAQAEVKKMMEETIQNHFVQSHKFNVLTRKRQDIRQYQKEVHLLQSGHAKQGEKIRAKQLLGADLLVDGRITNFDFYQTSQTFYGEAFKTWHVSMTVDYQLLETDTLAVRSSHTVAVELSSIGVNKALKKGSKTTTEIAQILVSKIARKIVTQVINDHYPLMVLTVQNNRVYLNGGTRRLRVGQRLNVYAKSKVLTDPSTSEKIKIRGGKTAVLEVMNVMPKYSTSKVISGTINNVFRGMLVNYAQTARRD